MTGDATVTPTAAAAILSLMFPVIARGGSIERLLHSRSLPSESTPV